MTKKKNVLRKAQSADAGTGDPSGNSPKRSPSLSSLRPCCDGRMERRFVAFRLAVHTVRMLAGSLYTVIFPVLATLRSEPVRQKGGGA